MIDLPPGDLAPRALRDPAVLMRRRALLAARPRHMARLIDYVAGLKARQPDWEVPDLDPASGGEDARILFLFEKPGPMTAHGRGSGFISMHNDDRTAEATYRFALERNRLPLACCLVSNVIPWWDGTRAISPLQRRLTAPAIVGLLGLLPPLRALVLVGATAQRAWDRSGLPLPDGVGLWRSAHPSPQVYAGYRERWEAIPSCWPTAEALDQSALPRCTRR
ncbi:hypothetical protein JMJ55_09315 [Belnapia sp. T6]|uniref:Uracil-DNA glycosylase-like domain-containing protein n=1 Tax=Belnapia mucosa TaxID=2804532 RepID=A0ABS1V1E7_9PROT|nr:hypothetical protein [Belnapia mucosa]MBL6455520.1 hypothetical protein [Belnapia mucosa]